MKDIEYSMMSIGRTVGMLGLSTTLFSIRGSLLLRPRGSHLDPGEGSNMVMSLKYCWVGEGPTGPY